MSKKKTINSDKNAQFNAREIFVAVAIWSILKFRVVWLVLAKEETLRGGGKGILETMLKQLVRRPLTLFAN